MHFKYIFFPAGFFFPLIITITLAILFLKGLSFCTKQSLAILTPHLSVHSLVVAQICIGLPNLEYYQKACIFHRKRYRYKK